MQCGPTRFVVDPRSLEAQAGLSHHIVVRETGFDVDGLEASAGIQDLYSSMAADGPRNDLIVEDVTSAIAEGRSPVVITERRDHLDHLAARLEHLAEVVVKLHGGMGTVERRAARKRLAQAGPRTSRLVLATGRYLGEGFDDARLDTLFLAMPVAWKGTIVQYAGRLHRRHPGKSEVRVYDYVDRNVPVLARMFEKRLKGYRSIGYEVHDDPFAFRLDGEGPYSDGADDLE
jgi:superfamily II DNA or RNA helicase